MYRRSLLSRANLSSVLPLMQGGPFPNSGREPDHREQRARSERKEQESHLSSIVPGDSGESLASTGDISSLLCSQKFLQQGPQVQNVSSTESRNCLLSPRLAPYFNQWKNPSLMFVNQGPCVLYLMTNMEQIKGPQTHCPWISQSRFWLVLSCRRMNGSSRICTSEEGHSSHPGIFLGSQELHSPLTDQSVCQDLRTNHLNCKNVPSNYRMNTNAVAEL